MPLPKRDLSEAEQTEERSVSHVLVTDLHHVPKRDFVLEGQSYASTNDDSKRRKDSSYGDNCSDDNAAKHIASHKKSVVLDNALDRLDKSVEGMENIFRDMHDIYQIVGDLRMSEKRMKQEHKQILQELKTTKDKVQEYATIQKDMQMRISNVIENVRNASPKVLKEKIDGELKGSSLFQQIKDKT